MSKAAKTEQHEHAEQEEERVHEFHAAFNQTAALRAALSPEDLAPINLDSQVALTTVMAALSGLAIYRDAIVEELPKFDIKRFDSLRTLAQALSYAHMRYVSASRPEDELQALQARGVELRDLLLGDAQALANRKLLDKKPLEQLKKAPGYLNMTEDLGALVTMIRSRWDVIKANSGIKPAELDEAEKLYEQITTAYGERQQIQQKVVASQEDRQRAYTVLLNGYDDARRAISYLRWKAGDVETIAPSLWAGRGSRSSSSSAANPPPASPGGGSGPAPVALSPAHPDPAAIPPGGPQPAAAPTVPSGNPFTN